MKKSILLLILASTTLSFAQKKPKIKGDKNVIETTFDLIDFNAIEVRDDLEITFSTQNYKNTYTLIADSNLYETIRLEVIDSVLKISSASKISSKKKLEIKVNAKKINRLILYNDCNIKQVGVLDSDFFELEAHDNAKIKLDVKASNIKTTMLNNASGDFFFQADSTRMTLSDGADIKGFFKSKHIDLDMYNDAEATLDGYCKEAKISMAGKPKLKAEKMIFEKVKIRESNNSEAEINCIDELKIFLEDKSKIYIYNSPNIIIEGLRDATEIIKR